MDVDKFRAITINSGLLEPWMMELANFVIDAYEKNKKIQCTAFLYQDLIFTPLQMMENLCNNKFVWGVINWRMID